MHYLPVQYRPRMSITPVSSCTIQAPNSHYTRVALYNTGPKQALHQGCPVHRRPQTGITPRPPCTQQNPNAEVRVRYVPTPLTGGVARLEGGRVFPGVGAGVFPGVGAGWGAVVV